VLVRCPSCAPGLRGNGGPKGGGHVSGEACKKGGRVSVGVATGMAGADEPLCTPQTGGRGGAARKRMGRQRVRGEGSGSACAQRAGEAGRGGMKPWRGSAREGP
jgi:hypothetical protein